VLDGLELCFASSIHIRLERSPTTDIYSYKVRGKIKMEITRFVLGRGILNLLIH
jgi:hypothetical protein